jgi:hypothetical protein
VVENIWPEQVLYTGLDPADLPTLRTVQDRGHVADQNRCAKVPRGQAPKARESRGRRCRRVGSGEGLAVFPNDQLGHLRERRELL